MTFRFADENDCSVILAFIRALADYEKMTDQVIATEELLKEWIFEKKKAEVLFVSEGEKKRVLPCSSITSQRSLEELAQITVERGCGRLEWACLDWNQPSIDFYRSLGAVPMEEWTTYRLTGDTLLEMAK